jgi:competence protein ComGC
MQLEEVSRLVELTEEFVEYLSNLFQEGVITKEQYDVMTKKKIEFINENRSLLSR